MNISRYVSILFIVVLALPFAFAADYSGLGCDACPFGVTNDGETKACSIPSGYVGRYSPGVGWSTWSSSSHATVCSFSDTVNSFTYAWQITANDGCPAIEDASCSAPSTTSNSWAGSCKSGYTGSCQAYCDATGHWDEDSYTNSCVVASSGSGSGGSSCSVTVNACDGVDNDCDGSIDEANECSSGSGSSGGSSVSGSITRTSCTLPDTDATTHTCDSTITWSTSGASNVKIFTADGKLVASGISGSQSTTQVSLQGGTLTLYAGCTTNAVSSCTQALDAVSMVANCASGYIPDSNNFMCIAQIPLNRNGCDGTYIEYSHCTLPDASYSTLVSGSCGLGYTGSCEARCNGIGEWDVESYNQTCTLIPGCGGTETCNGLDDNCDGRVDEGGVCTTHCPGGYADHCTWGDTSLNTWGMGTCDAGYAGSCTAYCKSTGNWNSSTYENTCTSTDPVGEMVSSGCFNYGWTCDGSNFDSLVTVQVYIDGEFEESFTAGVHDDRALSLCGNTNHHAFQYSVPEFFHDGDTHHFELVGRNLGDGSSNVVLVEELISCGSSSSTDSDDDVGAGGGSGGGAGGGAYVPPGGNGTGGGTGSGGGSGGGSSTPLASGSSFGHDNGIKYIKPIITDSDGISKAPSYVVSLPDEGFITNTGVANLITGASVGKGFFWSWYGLLILLSIIVFMYLLLAWLQEE